MKSHHRYASTSKASAYLSNGFDEEGSFSNDKHNKYKQKKIFRAQQILDLEQSKVEMESSYEKKLKKIE